jgi:biotin carboxyl carrier protein
MNFDVSVNGRPWKVAVEAAQTPGCFDVIVKGRSRLFDAAWIYCGGGAPDSRIDADTLSLIDAGSQAIAREITIERDRRGEMRVMVQGKSFHVTVETRAEKKGRMPLSQEVAARKIPVPSSGANGPQKIVAPMPGRVVRVLVAPGDRIVAGQGVVVMEAMKMENELRSPKDGVVREVAVVEGAAIDTGTVVAVIE